MTPLFEAKYIHINWHDKNSILKIDEAIFPISIEIEDETTCSIELQTYTRLKNGLHGQVAFHIFDIQSSIEPYFIDANNNKVSLFKITDPANNKIWWIEDGKWKKDKEKNERVYKESPLWNHAGDAKIVFGNIVCNITVRANSFTREQLDLYLSDFKNDVWYLILKKDSMTQGEAKAKEEKIKLLNNETIYFINKFIDFTEKILDNPKKELREVQRIKDIKRVKPVPKTFMEIATTGFQKKLTSRDTVKSYNVAENKFIYYILDRVYYIVFYMLRASEHIEGALEEKLQNNKKRVKSFTDHLKIGKRSLFNEIKDLKKKIQKEEEINNHKNLSEQIQDAINDQPRFNNQSQPQRYIITLENRQQDYGNRIQFWGKIRTPEANKWNKFKQDNRLSLEFNNIFIFLKSDQEYEIFASNEYTTKQTQNGTIYKIFFYNIIELKPKYKTLYIQLQKRQYDYDNKIQFWGKGKTNKDDNWFQFSNNDSLSLEFDKNIFDNVFEEYQEYKITGFIRKTFSQKKGGGKIHKRYFEYIENIERLTKSYNQKVLEKLENDKNKLESINWIRKLTPKEKQEQHKEKVALEQAIKMQKENQKYLAKSVENLKLMINKLIKLINKCKELKIKKDSYFPSSMTFVQNPNYQGSYNFYKKIKESVGIDENLFIQLLLVEKIGLLDMPTIYERWCYLQIIKVLIDKYRFQPENNWKIKLANQIMGNYNKIKNVKIYFTNNSIKREIDLWYEKVLKSGKKPDFVLDIKSTYGTKHIHRLVIDSKFHEKVDIKEQIELLYNKKNYSENDKNTVFILHPDTNKAIKKRLNPAEWGDNSYYGEVEMFDFAWDKDKSPYHKYGAIMLSPVASGDYIDNLQRLIGMVMQYTLEDNIDIKLGDINLKKDILDPYPRNKVFCNQCGSYNIKIVQAGYSKKKLGKFYEMKCKECKHSFVYFYCWNCSHRLIKNGRYWSYHAFLLTEPFDIKCPNCGRYWVDMTKNDENNSINQNINSEQLTNQNNIESKLFINHKDGITYIKNNPGTSLIRNPNGNGWITRYTHSFR